MRCISSGEGSFTLASRCISTPIGRCSRTACWAAATDFGRPMVTGITTPGNSTKLRTGMMIMASGGNGLMAVVLPVACGAPLAGEPPWSNTYLASVAATEPSSLFQGDREAPMHGRAAHRAIDAGRQTDAAFKPPLRQLEPVDHRRLQLGRQNPHAGDDEVGAID